MRPRLGLPGKAQALVGEPLTKIFFDVQGAFKPHECDDIIALARRCDRRPASVWGGAAYHVDERVRSCRQSYHARGSETDWIYERLDRLFAQAAAGFGIEVCAATDDFQLLEYPSGGHFQAWHTDAGADKHEARLISVSVELSDPGDFAGGTLEIPQAPRTEPLRRGGARLFLSRLIHRVTPVTRGTRWALVNWAGKPA
jgi:PKHD-type hydroxylase